MNKLWPGWHAIGREAVIVVGGAILAAAVISALPGVRKWINDQWGDTPRPF